MLTVLIFTIECIKENRYTCRRDNSVKMFLPQFLIGVYCHKVGNKFFPFSIDFISEGSQCTGKQTGCRGGYLTGSMMENYPFYLFPLKQKQEGITGIIERHSEDNAVDIFI